VFVVERVRWRAVAWGLLAARDNDYSPLIDASVIALVVCGVVCLAPTVRLDRARRPPHPSPCPARGEE